MTFEERTKSQTDEIRELCEQNNIHEFDDLLNNIVPQVTSSLKKIDEILAQAKKEANEKKSRD